MTMTAKRPSLRRRVARSGTAALELGLVAPVLVLLIGGTIDFGMAFWTVMQVGNAARAGAAYALLNGYNNSAIQTAVTSATSLSGVSASPAPSTYCGCPTTTGVTNKGTPPTNGCSSSSSKCSDGFYPRTYVKVSATASYTSVVPYVATLIGMSDPLSVTSQVIVRTQ
jgi:Flp pilus assembly protein TadG